MSEVRTKPVSAPARMSSRDDIWKEIRDWAKPNKRGEDDGEQGRVIGSQIKDNITEQRLLESRLLDLSKERYKFIVQVAWQRKAFVDRQKQKTGVMKDLLRNVDTSDTMSPSVQSGKNNNARLSDKLDSYRDLVKKTYSERQKLEMLKTETAPEEMKPIFPNSSDPIYKTEPSFSARNKSRPEFGLDRRNPNPIMFPAIEVPKPVTKSRQSAPSTVMRRQLMSRMGSSTRIPESSGGALKKSVSAENVPRYLKYRSVYDGRFRGLERSLSATYDGTSGPTIESILNGLPTRSMSVAK